MAYEPSEIQELANSAYDSHSTDKDRLFAFLVDVADAYVTILEDEAADDPAPFFSSSTPMQATMNGLRENLDLRRGDRTG